MDSSLSCFPASGVQTAVASTSTCARVLGRYRESRGCDEGAVRIGHHCSVRRTVLAEDAYRGKGTAGTVADSIDGGWGSSRCWSVMNVR
jgi:hypothetical protein